MAFNDATRQNIRLGSVLPYNGGASSSYLLPKVAYLARLHLHLSGTMTVTLNTGGATLGEKAPWNIFRRLRFDANNGVSFFNVSGWGAYLADICSKYQFEHEDGQISAAFSSQVYSAAAAAGANTWELALEIPLVPNYRDVAGIILLQSEGLQTTLNVDWQAAGGATQDFPVVLTGNATAVFTGNLSVYLETFTVPALIEDQPPIDTMYQTLETPTPVATTGEQIVDLLEANTFVRLIHSVEINDLLDTNDVDSMALRYNVTETPYDIERKIHLQRQRKIYGRDLPKGVFAWELFDQGYVNYGGGRDLLDASNLASLQSLIRLNTGTSLGVGNNRIRTITQQFVKLGGAGA